MIGFVKGRVRSFMGTRLAGLMPGTKKAVLKAWTNDPVYPRIMQLEPNRRCNLKCIMCALTQFYHKEKVPDMPLDLFKEIVTQLPDSLETVAIQGTGEPLLTKDMIEMIEFAKSRGFRTQFNSNMLLLTDEMAQRLVAAGHDEITVSIETTHPERYADIRRNGTIENFLASLDKIQKAKERAGSETPLMTACCILMKHTLKDIPKLVATLKRHGVVHMHLGDLCTYPQYDGELILADGTDLRQQSLSATMPEQEVWEKIAKVKDLADEDFRISVPGDWGSLKIEKPIDGTVLTCDELWKVPFAKPDGLLATCCWAPHFVMGDFKKQSFEEIWFGKEYHEMRKKHLTNRHPKHCRQCQQLMYRVASPSRFFGQAKPAKETNHVFLG